MMGLDRIGKYRVVGKIGKGAMGEVFKAQDPLLNRFVAIKTISPSLAAESDFRRRFQREAQSAAQLNHPNIITVFDFGEEDGLTYMAMELLDGRDLKEVIRTRGVHLGEKLKVMEQLCDGLGFAHGKGVIHRDLKPSNIHLQRNGQVKILDFGLARLGASDMTKTGTVMGTPHYMSPEQVRGEKADARSDVFSLGAVFYELLSQHRPFEAGSVHTVLLQILEKPPEPIRKWVPGIPPSLVSLVDKALAKDPAQRFADAAEMGRALAAARDEIGGETAVRPDAGDFPTMMQAADATVVEAPSVAGSVRGNTALSLARRPARTMRSASTVRPDPTISGEETQFTEPGSSRALVFGAAAAVVVVAAAAGFLWMRSRQAAPEASPAEVTHEQVGILTEALVTSQVELARADLANRDYDSAEKRASDALKLSPNNPDAKDVLDRARQTKAQVAAAATEARDALGRGDAEAASVALGRVMSLDPRHPVVAELSGKLNQHFRSQAEDGRGQAEKAQRAAEAGRATSLASFSEGRKLTGDAQVLFRRQEFAVAAQKYLEAKNAFEKASREAEEARAAAARPTPAPRPMAVARATPPGPTEAPAAVPTPYVTATPLNPVPAPTAYSTPTAAPSLAPTPAPATLAPAPSRVESPEAAVRQVIADYGRAIESQDISLYRTVKPDLTSDQEKQLRETFKVIKSQVVGITIDSVEVNGDHATVKLTRQDVVNGRSMKPTPQVIQLARAGGRWVIQ